MSWFSRVVRAEIDRPFVVKPKKRVQVADFWITRGETSELAFHLSPAPRLVNVITDRVLGPHDFPALFPGYEVEWLSGDPHPTLRVTRWKGLRLIAPTGSNVNGLFLVDTKELRASGVSAWAAENGGIEAVVTYQGGVSHAYDLRTLRRSADTSGIHPDWAPDVDPPDDGAPERIGGAFQVDLSGIIGDETDVELFVALGPYRSAPVTVRRAP